MSSSGGILLSIAGSDSSGGAGVQADLETFMAFRKRSASCITCVTAQSSSAVHSIFELPADIVSQQLSSYSNILAVKVGMLYSADIVQAVADFLSARPDVPIVVDPLVSATSGSRLLQPDAEDVFKHALLPLATVVTPNIDEALFLSGITAESPETAAEAAESISEEYGVSCVLTGGHGASDELYDTLHSNGRTEFKFSTRIQGVEARGTGCRFSSAIACGLAEGKALASCVEDAGRFTRAYIQSVLTS